MLYMSYNIKYFIVIYALVYLYGHMAIFYIYISLIMAVGTKNNKLPYLCYFIIFYFFESDTSLAHL